jgi:hypothetical protein
LNHSASPFMCQVFSRYGLTNYLPRLSLKGNPPDLCLLSSEGYRPKPPVPDWEWHFITFAIVFHWKQATAPSPHLAGEIIQGTRAWQPGVLELKTLWCWKQTHERENLDKAISFDQKGASMYSLHKMANSGFSLYSWCSCICLLLGICPGQRLTVSLNWLKGLGDQL